MTRARDLSNDEANNGGATPPFVAGKNRLINGDFGIWQRGTSFTSAGANFSADRMIYTSGGSPSVTRSTFTPGTAPSTGYEGQYFATFTKGNTTGNDMFFTQRMEDVRTFAGQTVTLSYWAKASQAVTNEPLTRQYFGTSGSTDVYTAYTTHSITTSWARYSVTFVMPSVAGKTIGANSFSEMYFWRYTGTTAITVDIWGVQLESGSVATPFTPAGGGFPGAELALCQRYYYRSTSAGALYQIFGTGYTDSATTAIVMIPIPTFMRIYPTSAEYSGLAFQEAQGGIFTFSGLTMFAGSATSPNNNIGFQITGASGMTTGRPGRFLSNNTLSGHLGFSAEL
jgi:hypothetical protein